jgi:hypothetical protein
LKDAILTVLQRTLSQLLDTCEWNFEYPWLQEGVKCLLYIGTRLWKGDSEWKNDVLTKHRDQPGFQEPPWAPGSLSDGRPGTDLKTVQNKSASIDYALGNQFTVIIDAPCVVVFLLHERLATLREPFRSFNSCISFETLLRLATVN